MKYEEVDKNFHIETNITEPDIVWLDVKNAPFVISGINHDEKHGCYTRMPHDLAEEIGEYVAFHNLSTAGGRVRFRTDSKFIGICAVMNTTYVMSHLTFLGQSGFDLYRKTEGECREIFYHSFVPPMGMTTGYSAPFTTDGAMADYTINFPLCDGVKELYIALKKDAVILEPTPYRHSVPIVYYGSSVTQGACASRPGNSYQAMLSRQLDTDYMNLGFCGNCKGQPLMVDYLASLNMSVFVCDYDYNAPNPEYLRETHLPLYRKMRAAQPTLPIIFMSSPNIRTESKTYIERRDIIRQTYQTALDEGDKNVYFIDGAELYEGEQWDSCTVDGCHPNDLGFFRMATRIERELKSLLK